MKKLFLKIVHAFKKDAITASALLIVFVFIFLAIFSSVLATPLPWVVLKNKSDIEIPRFPAFDVLFVKDSNRLENIRYRQLATEGKLTALFAPVPYSPYETSLDEILYPPSLGRFGHYMGTDNLGRDIASRIVHGTQNSIMVGLVAVGISLLFGILIGGLAGYFGGWIDIFLSRFIEIVICFPTLILIMAVLALLKPSLINIMVVIGVTGWTGIARIIRGEFLKRRQTDFVTAARLSGASHLRLIAIHILPNSIAPVVVMAAFGIAGAVLTESALSFLGIGVPVPQPSWGDVLKLSQEYPDIAWWLTFFPGFFIFLTVITFNLLGERLRKLLIGA